MTMLPDLSPMATFMFGNDQLTWQERDFTTPLSDKRNLLPMSQYYDSRVVMDTHDSLSWMGGCEDEPYNSVPAMYRNGEFALCDLQDMESTPTSSGHASPATSRTRSYCEPELPSPTGKICPLLSGQSYECTPQVCGSGAACLDFANVPEIEECSSVHSATHQHSNSSGAITQIPRPAPMSTAEPVSPRSSTSSSEKSPKTLQQRPSLQRESRQRPYRPSPKDADPKSHSKKAHSLVEKRYRENLNGNIAQLHRALQKTKQVSRHRTAQDQDDDEVEERRQALSKIRKSDVMLEAVDYVYQTEVEVRHMTDEIELLRSRVRQLEKLVKCEDCALMKQLVSFNL